MNNLQCGDFTQLQTANSINTPTTYLGQGGFIPYVTTGTSIWPTTCNVVPEDVIITVGGKEISMKSMVEFFDIICVYLGIKIRFCEFMEMSKSDRISFLRNVKIDKIVNDNN